MKHTEEKGEMVNLYCFTLEKGDKKSTLITKVSNPMELYVVDFLSNSLMGRKTEQEKENFYMNFVIPNGLQGLVDVYLDQVEFSMKEVNMFNN